VMIRRAFPAFVALVALNQTASAGVPLFGHVSCSVVRFYVSKYSEAAAERWARGHGAGEAEIETARRCLHPTYAQTASPAVRSAVLTKVAGQERAQNEPAELNPVQQPSMQGQRANPEQDKLTDEPAAPSVTHPSSIEGRAAHHVSHETKDLAPPSDTTTLRPRHASRTHRGGSAGTTGHVGWLKRIWARLTRPHQFRIAFLHFRDGGR
jgi:hypothetical protein